MADSEATAAFDFADLSSARMTKADLAGARFRHVDLRGADFTDADLRGARFAACTLEGVTFSGADLSDAALVESSCDTAIFDGTRLARTETVGSSFRQARLTDAREFLACREILVEVLWRGIDRSDPEAVALVGVVMMNRHWCYAEWKDYLDTPDREQYLVIAQQIFEQYRRSGAAQALAAGLDWRTAEPRQ